MVKDSTWNRSKRTGISGMHHKRKHALFVFDSRTVCVTLLCVWCFYFEIPYGIKRRRTETDRAEKQVCSREEKKGLETCCDYLHTWHTSLISVSGITHLLAKRHIQTSNCTTFTTETSVNRDCKLGNDTKQRFCSVSASSFVGPKCLLIRSSFFFLSCKSRLAVQLVLVDFPSSEFLHRHWL